MKRFSLLLPLILAALIFVIPSFKAEAATKIKAPTITVTTSDNSPKISWTKVSGATKYRVYRKTESDKKWVKVADTKKTSIVDKKLDAKEGTTVQYRVKAIDKSKNFSSASKTKKWTVPVQDQLVLTAVKDQDGNYQKKYEYNKDGLLISEIDYSFPFYLFDKTTYEYNENQKVSKSIRTYQFDTSINLLDYGFDPEAVSEKIYSDSYIFEYDSAGNCIKQESTSGNYCAIYTYDKNNTIIYEEITNLRGTTKKSYQYNSLGLLIVEKVTFNNSTSTYCYEYDDHNNVTKEEVYQSNGETSIIQNNRYTYIDEENYIQQYDFFMGGVETIYYAKEGDTWDTYTSKETRSILPSWTYTEKYINGVRVSLIEDQKNDYRLTYTATYEDGRIIKEDENYECFYNSSKSYHNISIYEYKKLSEVVK